MSSRLSSRRSPPRSAGADAAPRTAELQRRSRPAVSSFPRTSVWSNHPLLEGLALDRSPLSPPLGATPLLPQTEEEERRIRGASNCGQEVPAPSCGGGTGWGVTRTSVGSAAIFSHALARESRVLPAPEIWMPAFAGMKADAFDTPSPTKQRRRRVSSERRRCQGSCRQKPRRARRSPCPPGRQAGSRRRGRTCDPDRPVRAS
jgi:hypothetical protein